MVIFNVAVTTGWLERTQLVAFAREGGSINCDVGLDTVRVWEVDIPCRLPSLWGGPTPRLSLSTAGCMVRWKVDMRELGIFLCANVTAFVEELYSVSKVKLKKRLLLRC